MCSVIGFCGKGGDTTARVLNSLLAQSKIRGLHAFGVATGEGKGGKQIQCERYLSFEDAQEHLASVSAANGPLKLIAHCRYSTSGEWHKPENNQPLVLSTHGSPAALAFNGVIRMTTNREWGKEFGFAPVTDNDGEIFLRKVLDGEDWQKWVSTGSFSFAGVMLYRGQLIALRNRMRPLYLAKRKEGVYIGSTADIFLRAGVPGATAIPEGKALFWK